MVCGARVKIRRMKLLVGIDIVICGVILVLELMALFLILMLQCGLIDNPGILHETLTFYATTLTLSSFTLIVDIILHFWVWLLINDGNWVKIRVWIYIKTVLEICDALVIFVEVVLLGHATFFIIGTTFDLFNFVYVLWVLYTFTKITKQLEKRSENNKKNGVRGLQIIAFNPEGNAYENVVS